MDRNAYRDDNGTDQPEPYWRRRAAILAAGLGLLGLLAWAFSGGGQPAGPAPRNSPASGALSAATAPPSVPAYPAPATANAATANAARSTAKTARPDATRSAVSAAPGGRCPPGAVVLSLFGSGRSFPAGQNPEFGVDAVSTAPGTCTFDLSPAQLHLVVMSAGRVIWDSADCARGDGTQLSRLSRGVPVQEYFTWNRAITLPGCVTLASAARPGSYTAQVKTPAASSGVYTFRLSH
jgi:hypothetical protein